MEANSLATGTPLAALRRLARSRPPEEVCELCGVGIQERHPHLVEAGGRRVVCSCRACSLLFSHRADTKYRLVPEVVRHLDGFQMPDELWESLLIPVDMAFFFHGSAAGKVVALYPGPAGVTESLLTLDGWRELEKANPELLSMEPDVEALLVNRVGGARDCYLAPIDRCYELVGIIRSRWKGLSGGTEVWVEVGRFFQALKAEATRDG